MSRKIAIARLIAARGLASRRKAEQLITDGKVLVNGDPVEHPAFEVDPERDHIRVDGEVLPAAPPPVHYVLFKPKGCITGRNDPEGRKSIFDLIDLPHRVEPVGRLDFDTEGALLLTNDGALAHALTHPSRQVPKRYAVKVWKRPSDRALDDIREGRIFLEDGRVPPCLVRVLDDTDAGNTWIEITVTEGRNRLIRRLFAQIGHPVSKLRRESFATISVRGMDRSQLRPLTAAEVRRLHDLAEGRTPERAGKVRYKEGFARPKPKKERHGKRTPKVVAGKASGAGVRGAARAEKGAGKPSKSTKPARGAAPSSRATGPKRAADRPSPKKRED